MCCTRNSPKPCATHHFGGGFPVRVGDLQPRVDARAWSDGPEHFGNPEVPGPAPVHPDFTWFPLLCEVCRLACTWKSTDGGGMTPDEEARALGIVAERVRERHPTVDQGEIVQRVQVHAEEFDGRPIRDFVPLLVERQVLADLRA